MEYGFNNDQIIHENNIDLTPPNPSLNAQDGVIESLDAFIQLDPLTIIDPESGKPIDFNYIIPELRRLYISNYSRYVIMKPGMTFVPKTKHGFRKLDDTALYSHLIHKTTVCIFGGETGSKFMCFDVDLPDADVLRGVIFGLTSYGIPYDNIYVSSSGGKGYHVEIFFDGEVPTPKLHEMYMYITETQDLPRSKVEFRPTPNLSIKLPLGIHMKTGNMCWFLDKTTLAPITGYAGYNLLFNIRRLDPAVVVQLIDEHHAEYEEFFPARPAIVDSNVSFPIIEDGNFPKLTEPGTRHNTMVAIAVYLRARGYSAAEIVDELLEWADQQDRKFFSSDRDDVIRDAAEIAKWAMANGHKYAKPFITQKELNFVIAQPTPLRRKLVFFLALFFHRSGKIKLPARRISYYVGGHPNYITDTLMELMAERYIKRDVGAAHNVGGEPRRDPNTYCPGARWPVGGGDSIELADYEYTASGFSGAYWRALADNVAEDVLAATLRPKERREMQEFFDDERAREEAARLREERHQEIEEQLTLREFMRQERERRQAEEELRQTIITHLGRKRPPKKKRII